MRQSGTFGALRAQAERGPIEADISDYSDEWCAGFLAGQVNLIDFLDRNQPTEMDRLVNVLANKAINDD